MKKTILILIIITLFVGCNINPSKEARIQKLESEMQIMMDKVNELENKVETLEVTNEQLKNEGSK